MSQLVNNKAILTIFKQVLTLVEPSQATKIILKSVNYKESIENKAPCHALLKLIALLGKILIILNYFLNIFSCSLTTGVPREKHSFSYSFSN